MTEILIGGQRLSHAQARAVNEMLRRRAGEQDGQPLYKLTWAADDNRLARRHGVGCPKTNPMDWTCECPLADPGLLPICFFENQQSYHLLCFEPPSMAMQAFEAEAKQDFSRGTYACVMHFVDPETGRPMSPATLMVVVVEHLMPVLQTARTEAQLGEMGFQAVVEQRRRARRDAQAAEQARADRAYQQFAEQVLEETTYVAHDGNVKPTRKEEVCR